MTQIEFFVTMKVTCEHDEQGYWGDQTLEQVKETAIQLLQPNFNTIENGVKLKKVEVEFHSDDDINNAMCEWCNERDFYPEDYDYDVEEIFG